MIGLGDCLHSGGFDLGRHSTSYRGPEPCIRLFMYGGLPTSPNRKLSLLQNLSLRTAVLLAFSFISTTADATVVYSQNFPADPHAAFASFEAPVGQKVADNFSLSGVSPIEIRSLRFIGGADAQPDNFRIVFFEECGWISWCSPCGADFDIGPATSRTPTNGHSLNGVTTPREYIINLPGSVQLAPNTPYWLSIVNDLWPVSGWGLG